MLSTPWVSLAALFLLMGASALGSYVRRHIAEHHRSRETIELLQVTVTMLVTFAAIVLGLLITSAKASFDDADNDLRTYAVALVQLDLSLTDQGAPATPIRQQLARYTAAAIATTWTGQTPPPGNYYPHTLRQQHEAFASESPALGQMLETVNSGIHGLPNATPAQARAVDTCVRQMQRVLEERWRLIEASQGTLSTPFLIMLVFWLVVIFLCFGLSAPSNYLAALVIVLSAIALTSALFVIIDLTTLYDNGFFTISSIPMRDALQHMLSQPSGLPQ